MRSATLFFVNTTAAPIPGILPVGGRCVGLSYTICGTAGSTTGHGQGTLRLAQASYNPTTKATGTLDTDVLATVSLSANGGTYFFPVDFRIDDRQTVYVCYVHTTGTAPTSVSHSVTFWFSDLQEPPEEDLPQARLGIRTRGRSVNLEAARRLLSGLDRGERLEKPSH